jgi:peptidoglycan-N-acetylglucosamine deacetylase
MGGPGGTLGVASCGSVDRASSDPSPGGTSAGGGARGPSCSGTPPYTRSPAKGQEVTVRLARTLLGSRSVARLCALSVDLDEIPHYAALHGLAAPTGLAAHAVYDLALVRLARLAEDHRVPLTLFAVGADLQRPENAARVRELSDQGFEIANHSLDHRYDLTRLPPEAIAHQVRGGIEAIEQATGQRPSGFRAPGYLMTDALLDALVEAGVRYDSSVFACPAYVGAKALAMRAIRLRGRASRAVQGDLAVLRAPTRPYQVGRPYWQRGDGLVEFPIQTTPHLRLPVIGTTITLLGASRARRLVRRVAREPFVNLELHGIDALDALDFAHQGDPFLERLAHHQADLRVPLWKKLDALAAAIETLQAAGYAFVRLDEAARRVLEGNGRIE